MKKEREERFRSEESEIIPPIIFLDGKASLFRN